MRRQYPELLKDERVVEVNSLAGNPIVVVKQKTVHKGCWTRRPVAGIPRYSFVWVPLIIASSMIASSATPLYHISVEVGKAPEYVSIKPTNTVMPSNLLVVQLVKGSFVQCCHSPVKVVSILCSQMLIHQIDSSCQTVFIHSRCFRGLFGSLDSSSPG